MTDLSLAERSTIEAVVDGVQRRTMKRRKRARQGWAFLLSGALSIPIILAITIPLKISLIVASSITIQVT